MWMGMLATKNKRLLHQQRLLIRQLAHQDSSGSRRSLDDVCFDNAGGLGRGMLKEIESLDSLDDEEVWAYGSAPVIIMVAQ